MTIGAVTSGSYSYVGKTANVSQHAGLSHNHQKAVEADNAKGGGNYSIDVEQRATNAQLALLI